MKTVNYQIYDDSWHQVWRQVDVNINNIYDEILERVNNNV